MPTLNPSASIRVQNQPAHPKQDFSSKQEAGLCQEPGGKVEPTAAAGFASILIKGLSERLACAPQHPKAGGLRCVMDDPPLQVGLGGLPIPGMANPTLITGCSLMWPATPSLLTRGQPLWSRVSP